MIVRTVGRPRRLAPHKKSYTQQPSKTSLVSNAGDAVRSKVTTSHADARYRKKACVGSMLALVRCLLLINRHPNCNVIWRLIGLVHCYHHKHGHPRQIRLDEWVSVFPSRPDQPSLSPLVERQIAKCFGRLMTMCMGPSRKGIRCKNPIGGQKLANCTKTISQICETEVYLSDIKLGDYLQVLAMNICCRFHTDQSLSKNVLTWKEKILAIRNEADLGPTDQEDNSSTGGSEKQISTPNHPES